MTTVLADARVAADLAPSFERQPASLVDLLDRLLGTGVVLLVVVVIALTGVYLVRGRQQEIVPTNLGRMDDAP